MATIKEIFEFRGVPVVILSDLRMQPTEKQEGLYYYDVRYADDESGYPATIEHFVRVNHLGTIATTIPLLSVKQSVIELTEEESCEFALYI